MEILSLVVQMGWTALSQAFNLIVYSVIPFLLLMGSIVFMHELGHYIAARIAGITVKDFSLGIGKLLWQRQGRHNTWSLRLFPIGGFVRVPEEGPGSLAEASTRAKIGFVAAGPAMNFVLGFAFFVLAFQAGLGFTPTVIKEVTPGSPAAIAGIQPGDRITAINGVRMRAFEDIMVGSLYGQPNQTDIIQVTRGESTLAIPVEKQNRTYGIRFQREFATDTASTFRLAKDQMIAAMWSVINVPRLVHANGGDAAQLFSGPVGIAHVTGEVVKGPKPWLVGIQLIALLNIGIGVFNLLPLPVLDGGRILIYSIEGVLRRRTPMRLNHFMAGASVVVMLAIGTLVTVKDISELFVN